MIRRQRDRAAPGLRHFRKPPILGPMPIAIGDIHGCLRPLRRLLARLPRHQELVFLGDYIDRGPASAAVLSTLISLAGQRPCRFLLGNHEQLLLDAIRPGAEAGPWLMNGGDATLASYGLTSQQWARQADRGAFLGGHLAFLESLALYHEDAQTIFVHAGIDPTIPEMADQRPEVLLWVRERFFRRAHHWRGKQIVFGHTPTFTMGLPHETIFQAGRLFGIDTGCVFGGCLTALDMESHLLYQEPAAARPSRSLG